MKAPIFNQIERLALRYYFEHKQEFKHYPIIVIEWHYFKLKQSISSIKTKFLKIFSIK